ncbi:hypothetical protein MKX03_027431 [Papaver bracteatum]|nr:hypothetical protein MKX03_027431 [Papaver bracteatum]
METSVEHLLLLLKKMQELEAEHANLQHEFSSLILYDDVSSRPKMSDLRKSSGSARHSSSQYCNDQPHSCNGIGLTSSDKQYLNILQSLGQSIHIFDSSGLLIYWNQSAEKLYGYSASEALGQSILDLLTDAKEAREDAIDIMQCNAAGETWTGNFPVKNKQGQRFMVFVTNTPLYDDYSSIVGIICVSFDVQSFLQLPLPYSEAYSSFSPSTSGPTSKPGYDSQQPLEVVVTASGACTLRGEVPPFPFGLSYKAVHMDNYPGFFPEDSGGESKIQIHNNITSNIEAWNIEKQISWKCKGSEHDGLVARNAHDIFPWTKNEQEDDSDQKKSPDSYEKPEMQLLGSNRFGNEASASWSSSNATNKSSVNSSINTGSSPLCKFDRETDSLHYDILWEDLMIYEQIGRVLIDPRPFLWLYTITTSQVIGAVGFMDQRMEIPKDTDPHWASLIESCWHSEPKCRPSFQDLLKKLKVMQKRYSIETQATQLEPRGSITTVATYI